MITKDKMICENIGRTASGELTFGGVAVTSLAKKYGTPLYLYDEDRIRSRAREYISAARRAFGDDAILLYASKAASFGRLYKIIMEEGFGIDVVSSGEIFAAARVGFPLENSYFHSNNKTDADIEFAMENRVGQFVVDCAEELCAIDRIAGERGIRQRVLLRITPGIDPHTYAAVATGKVDSKFGSAIETGQAYDITSLALSLPNIELYGFHSHIGSQVFDADVYLKAADVMLGFVAEVNRRFGYIANVLDIGGGLGVRYVDDHPRLDISSVLLSVGEFMKSRADELGIKLPRIALEPGRSIVADAGMTVYTVGSVKRITGYKAYVSVDGGMTDNPRYALYGSPYTLLLANPNECDSEEIFSVVGRCCESGDILQENVPLPADIKRGDILACLTTGAYNYAMSSNYNRIGRLPIAMINGDSDYLAVKRETLEDIAKNDI